MKTIDQIGTDVARQVKSLAAKVKSVETQQEGLEKERLNIQPELRRVVDTIKSGTPVNGCKTVKQWCAEVAKVTPRYVQYILKGKRDRRDEVEKRTSGSPVTVHLNNVQVDSDSAYCVIEIEQSHEVKYQGRRLDGRDYSYAEDNGNITHEQHAELDKAGKAIWRHKVQEVSGSLTVTVENDSAMTEEQLTAALLKKTTAVLKSMRLWDDKLFASFNGLLQESAEWEAERKERRSEGAKKAAATRKARKPKVRVSRSKRVISAMSEVGRKATKLIQQFRNDLTYTAAEYRADLDHIVAELKARDIYQHNPTGFDAHFKDMYDRAGQAIADRSRHYPEQNPAAAELEETLDSLPPTPVNDCPDYSMEDVKALFEETN